MGGGGGAAGGSGSSPAALGAVLSEVWKDAPELASLTLSMNFLCEAGLQALLATPPAHTASAVTHLDLSYNCLGPPCAKLLVQGLERSKVCRAPLPLQASIPQPQPQPHRPNPNPGPNPGPHPQPQS